MIKYIIKAFDDFMCDRITREEYQDIYSKFVDILNPTFRGVKLTKEDIEFTFKEEK